MSFNSPLPPELQDAINGLRQTAEEAGLDFFETIFELVDYKQLNEMQRLRRLSNTLSTLALWNGL